ncbi:MAG: biotin--[acetyl-CoA-carboxylase] ligase [Planctomycetes bacterium]|nr:biotin--[acetyl-CoA-carboxylase] ligase [Planctomycetota bacterium]
MKFEKTTWLDSVDSTNTYLRAMLEADPSIPSGTVIAAKEQTAGRGQFGRTWLATPGQNLTFSFLLKTEVDLAWVPSLPMAIALAVSETLSAFGVNAQVKWPNDVLVGNRKICGILVDNIYSKNQIVLISGIGLNVNMPEEEAEKIDRPATSILIETGVTQQVEVVLDALLKRLPSWIGRWSEGGFPEIKKDWIACAAGLGHRAIVRQRLRKLEGILEDFGENGELILKEENGQRRMVWTGDLETNGSVA